MAIPFIAAGVIGYVLGSFPTAYLVVKWKFHLDIRQQGSGNVGTLNSFEVTGSKVVGLVVLLVDLLKGVLSVLAVREIVNPSYATMAVGGLCAVLGHNFPIWLAFKGGRGLATAAGVMLMLGWVAVPVWMAFWLGGKKLFGDVNVGNAVATIAMVLTAVAVPWEVVAPLIPGDVGALAYRLTVALLAALILIRLIEPVREYVGSRKNNLL